MPQGQLGGTGGRYSYRRLTPSDYNSRMDALRAEMDAQEENTPPPESWGHWLGHKAVPTAIRTIPAVGGSIGGAILTAPTGPGAIGGAVGGGALGSGLGEAGAQAYEKWLGDRKDYSPGEMALQTAIGGATGMLPGVGAEANLARRLAIHGIQGAGISTAGTVGSSLIERGELPSLKDTAVSAGLGGTIGAATGAAFGRPKGSVVEPPPAVKGPGTEIGPLRNPMYRQPWDRPPRVTVEQPRPTVTVHPPAAGGVGPVEPAQLGPHIPPQLGGPTPEPRLPPAKSPYADLPDKELQGLVYFGDEDAWKELQNRGRVRTAGPSTMGKPPIPARPSPISDTTLQSPWPRQLPSTEGMAPVGPVTSAGGPPVGGGETLPPEVGGLLDKLKGSVAKGKARKPKTQALGTRADIAPVGGEVPVVQGEVVPDVGEVPPRFPPAVQGPPRMGPPVATRPPVPGLRETPRASMPGIGAPAEIAPITNAGPAPSRLRTATTDQLLDEPSPRGRSIREEANAALGEVAPIGNFPAPAGPRAERMPSLREPEPQGPPKQGLGARARRRLKQAGEAYKKSPFGDERGMADLIGDAGIPERGEPSKVPLKVEPFGERKIGNLSEQTPPPPERIPEIDKQVRAAYKEFDDAHPQWAGRDDYGYRSTRRKWLNEKYTQLAGAHEAAGGDSRLFPGKPPMPAGEASSTAEALRSVGDVQAGAQGVGDVEPVSGAQETIRQGIKERLKKAFSKGQPSGEAESWSHYGKELGRDEPASIPEFLDKMKQKLKDKGIAFGGQSTEKGTNIGMGLGGGDFEKLEQEARKLKRKAIWAGQDAGEWLGETLASARAYKAGGELSPTFRQGGHFRGRPEFWRAVLGGGKQALMSEEGAQTAERNLKARPSYEKAKNAGIFLSDDKNLEESVISKAPEKGPFKEGSKPAELYQKSIGRLYRATNRYHPAMLNELRVNLFERLTKDAAPEDVSRIVDYINSGTGRGKLKFKNPITGTTHDFEGAANLLNKTFFSARFAKSRADLMNPTLYTNKATRAAAWRDMATNVGLVAAANGMAYLAGADVTMNPTSPDFGKVKIGKSRIDFSNGMQPYIRLLAQAASLHKTSSVTGKEVSLNTGKFGSPTLLDTLERFAEGKMAPLPAFAANVARGKKVTGEDTKYTTPNPLENEFSAMFTPMIVDDIYNLMKTDPKASPLMIPGAILGESVQTYGEDKNARPKKRGSSRTPPRRSNIRR